MNTHLLADRYLLDDLEDDELAEFEERLVWDELLVEEVQLAEQLRDGLRAAAADDRFAEGSPGVRKRFAGWLSVPQYSAAASFLFAVTLTSAVFLGSVNDVNVAEPPPMAQVVRLEVTRDSSAIQVAVDSSKMMVFLVDVPRVGTDGTFIAYRASVRPDATGAAPIWARDGLETSYEDSLAIALPGSALTAARYILTIEGTTDLSIDEPVYEHIQVVPFQSAPAE